MKEVPFAAPGNAADKIEPGKGPKVGGKAADRPGRSPFRMEERNGVVEESRPRKRAGEECLIAEGVENLGREKAFKSAESVSARRPEAVQKVAPDPLAKGPGAGSFTGGTQLLGIVEEGRFALVGFTPAAAEAVMDEGSGKSLRGEARHEVTTDLLDAGLGPCMGGMSQVDAPHAGESQRPPGTGGNPVMQVDADLSMYRTRPE